MRNIIRNRGIVADHWRHLADEDVAPAFGDITVSWLRWQDQRADLLAHGDRIGVRLNGDVPVQELSGGLDGLDLIVVEFPAFTDGRCYSHARLLRARHGYTGEIRATGNVLRDQLAYMARVGINAFELEQGRSLEDALLAFREFSVDYQGLGNAPFPLRLRRLREAA